MCPLGLGTALPQGLSPRPRSPFQDPSCGEGRYLWCLRNPIELARPRGRRQDTRVAGSGLAYHHCRDLPWGAGQAWLCCCTHKAVFPAHPRQVLPELFSTKNTNMEALPLIGNSGPH